MHMNLFTDSGAVHKKGIVVSTTVLEGDYVNEVVVHRPFEFDSEHSCVTELIGLYNGMAHLVTKYPTVSAITVVCDNLDVIRFLGGQDSHFKKAVTLQTFARFANTINRIVGARQVSYVHRQAKNCAQIQLCDTLCNRVAAFYSGKRELNLSVPGMKAAGYHVCGLA